MADDLEAFVDEGNLRVSMPSIFRMPTLVPGIRVHSSASSIPLRHALHTS